ncbi:winged helix-turn-helix domain-containing protein [Sabulilitoribacter arenilitoris]|uniref:Winged helix-turn-helix domain-containing protein n=1 Tax=Wocania arenilitoris TaxID=2044858 RepID=A0AAE3ELB4_9FLAO|nr:winged helix-turn-helix domain-containing protein [Wocania arenilitoris]MCF7567011.1 winged helix-turn-helix domain-containing protein [Wocania arenilitoris]
MGRQATIIIKESIEELKDLHKKESNPKLRRRLKCLIYTKENKYKTQTILATHLGVDYSSLKRWFKLYREEGLASYLSINSGGNKASIITPKVHHQLEQKVNNASNPLKGYWEAQLWLKNNFGLEMKYNTVRTYLIRHFKTKIKVPRKSHYKKDEQAIEAFFKTSK